MFDSEMRKGFTRPKQNRNLNNVNQEFFFLHVIQAVLLHAKKSINKIL